jgi:hypothetical protein
MGATVSDKANEPTDFKKGLHDRREKQLRGLRAKELRAEVRRLDSQVEKQREKIQDYRGFFMQLKGYLDLSRFDLSD